MQEVLKNAESRMKKSIESTLTKLSHIQTGRATTALLDQVTINYYGSKTPLNQVGTVTTPEPGQLVIQPWDKSLITEIEKAIAQSDLGLATSNDGSLIRIQVPELTTERRVELTKLVKKLAEEGRVAIRNIRRDANDSMRKLEGNDSGAGSRRSKGRGGDKKSSRADADPVQKLTDIYVNQINELAEAKETELLEN